MKRVLLSILIAGTALAAGAAAAAPQEYRLTILGLDSNVTGVNNLGQAVGTSLVNGQNVATVWTNGVASYLPSIGGGASYATDINNLGVVSGAALGADGKYHAVTWNGGVATVLNGTNASVANAINDSGVVVGSATINGSSYAQQWSGGTATTLAGRSANDINNSGAVVSDNLLIKGATQTDLAAQYTYWDTHNGANWPYPTTVYAINDQGAAAGTVVADHNGFSSVAVIWGQNGIVSARLSYDLPYHQFNDINNGGQAVGYSVYDAPIPFNEATLWNGSALVNINSLLSTADRYNVHLSTGNAINDSGVIVGQTALFNTDPEMPWMVHYAGYILTPVPEPETYAMLAVGLLLVGAAVRRRQKAAV
ncbi:PEP-CTERM protein-sorting domain-containing protein [Duganella sp. CF402]|uniref:PEP-CTERM sorting domain-containing protein n=1 Tax=unclassified Duganella TaxID=2636909 RepID=UPI0008AF3E75|nr:MULTISPECIES: PEP-CTERM sorting domain-containing protein [unclassified Duganella]RZT04545.1 putative secreted protein with PEP-CTERM sorting signal [Duganella sp. BK701]SEM32636.1 PEP-CTERM protein-sorting domain-containing protein [Duganella sp. CF402]